MNEKKALYIAVGAVIGGITGYLTASLAIYKLYPQYVEVITTPVAATDKTKNQSLAYGQAYHRVLDPTEKAKLEDLSAPYKSTLEIKQPEKPERKPEHMVEVLDSDQFADSPFPSRTIYFYEKDAVYATIDDDKIENPEKLVENAHLHFGEGNDDPDCVYIRNHSLREDFEVQRVHDSFSFAVLGIEPEVTTSKRKKPRAKPKVVPGLSEEEDE